MPPCELSALIADIETLEQRISGENMLDSRLLPTPQLMDLLVRLGNRPPAAAQESVQRLNLSTSILDIIDNEIKPRQRNHLLSMRQASLINAAEQIFFSLEKTADVDPLAFNTLRPLLADVVRLLLDAPDALNNPAHPVRRLIEILLKICSLYDAYSGQRADLLIDQAGKVIATLVGAPLPINGVYETAARELVNLFNTHNEQNLLLAKTLIAKEQGQSLRDDAKLKVNREMLETLDGHRLPRFFVQFLERVWSKYLYVTYLRHGIDGREWRNGLESIRILADSLNIQGRDAMFQFYAKHLSGTLTKVREAAFSIHQDEYLVHHFLQRMDAIHIDIMDEKTPNLGDVLLISAGSRMDSAATLPDADNGSAPLAALRVGDWYRLEERGLKLRCKLVERNRQHAYCLFANLSGIKVGRYAFGQITAKLQEGSLRRLNNSAPMFQSALEHACKSLQQQLPKLQQQAVEAQQARARILELKHQAEVAEKLRQIELLRQQREEQQRRERLRQEQERQRREAEQRAQAQREAREKAIEDTVININRMQSGGWLELINRDNQRISCKLGLRIKSTGKLIFVDSLGRKVIEFQPRQLAESIVDGSASIVDFGIAFDETLGHLIVERSEKITTDEER
jgi:hypothetical protein